MTTETVTDLGNGWTRRGQDALWAGDPRPAFTGQPVRDLLRLSMWLTGGAPVLRIEIDNVDAEDDLTDLGLFGGSADLPAAALPELGTVICRILASRGQLAGVLERIFGACLRSAPGAARSPRAVFPGRARSRRAPS